MLSPERAIGCVVYPATTIEAPGVIRHLEGTRFSIGEPSGEISERCKALSDAMIAGGLKAPVEADWTDEKVWKGCNPALGDFRSIEEMRIVCARARAIPVSATTWIPRATVADRCFCAGRARKRIRSRAAGS